MIKDSSIEKIKDICNIQEVVGSFISLKRSGSGYQACCPFHNERTPSFHVTPARQIFKCFGCGKGGDSIAFVMEMEKISFIEAIEWLAKFYNQELEYDDTGMSAQDVAASKSKLQRMSEVLQTAHGYFQSSLMNSPATAPVWQYLKNRNHTAEVCMNLQIGYAPGGWQGLVNLLSEKHLLEEAREIDIVKEGKGGKLYDQFRNRIMFPIFNKHNQLAGFSGRSLIDGDVKYMNSSESSLFKKQSLLLGWKTAKKPIEEAGFAYIVEGNFDMSSLFLSGIENVVAPCGTALTISQLNLLKTVTKNIVLLGDPDEAGRKSVMRSIDLALTCGLQPDVIEMEEGIDPADWVVKELNEIKLSTINN